MDSDGGCDVRDRVYETNGMGGGNGMINGERW